MQISIDQVRSVLKIGGELIHRHLGLGSVVELIDAIGVTLGNASDARAELLIAQELVVIDTNRAGLYRQSYGLAS